MNTKSVCLTLSALTLGAAAYANTAVSEVNGKLSGAYGNLDSVDGKVLQGSVSVPFLESLGFQFDGLYTQADEVQFTGLGGHFFWRESDQGLVGLSGGAVFGDEVDSMELSLEGEYYFDWVTVGAKAGWSSIEYEDAVPFIDTDKDGAFAQAFLTAYPLKDLAITAAIETRLDNSYASIDAEYELPVSGLSLFASFMKGENEYEQSLFGLRYYFGGDKSLKQRHREDDPENALGGILSSIGNYGAKYNKQAKAYYGDSYEGGYYGSYGSVSYISVGVVGPE